MLFRSKGNQNEQLGFDKAADWKSATEASKEAAKIAAAGKSGSGNIPGGSAAEFTYESCYLREMRHLLDAVAGKIPYTGCSMQEELHTVAAFHAVLKSAQEGREISVD